jgi:CreA protein
MKRQNIIMIIIAVLLLLFVFGLTDSKAGPTAVRIDRFKAIDSFGPNDYDLETLRIDDPENPFVSIYVTHIIATGFVFSDPSNTSIACRLTGKIPIDKDGKQIINKTTNHDIAHFRKSIGSKEMKISRAYDPEKNVLIYNVYTTKLFGGSLKHSLSVVPLGTPLAP